MRRFIAACGIGSATFAFALSLGFARDASAGVVDSYCSPSGDYCTQIKKRHGAIKLRIGTFSFSGKYELCVKPKGEARECQDFRLSREDDIYKDSVNWARHFTEGPGKHKATWFYPKGNQLGPALIFRG